MQLLIVNVNLDPSTLEGCEGIRESLLRIAPEAMVSIQHWSEIPESWPCDDRWDATVLGPNETPFPAYPEKFEGFLRRVKEHRKPMLGICGGHQVLGMAFGSEVGPVFDVPAPTQTYAGLPKIKGLVSLNTKGDGGRLLSGLSDRFVLDASHVEELRDIPQDFELLASSEACDVQVIGHRELPLYGVQCHPERKWQTTSGRRLLSNFLEVVDFAASST